MGVYFKEKESEIKLLCIAIPSLAYKKDKGMLKIILVEDNILIRNGIKVLLECEDGFDIVGEAGNGQDALELVRKEQVDLVLTDMNMPIMGGIEFIEEMKLLNSDLPVVVLSMAASHRHISQAFMKGAGGYLLKNISSDELIFALKHVANGNKYLCSELSIEMLEKSAYF